MSFDLSLVGGAPVRLTTAGKYCDRDIIVRPEDLTEPLSEQNALLSQIQTELADKLAPASGSALPTQEKSVNVTENGEYAVEPDDGYTLSKVTVSVQVEAEAPADPRNLYQRVEYITSGAEDTYPYIVTDFYADNNAGVEIIASFPELVDRVPMGSREDSGSTRFYCVYPLSASSIYYGFNGGSSITCKLEVDTIYRLQTNFLNCRLVNVYDADGIRAGGGTISATLTEHSVPVAIFGCHSATSGTVTSKREYKLYSARCSRGHEVVREYIPCIRKSDGAVGVYETHAETFLGNADPEGSAFVAGPNIDW